MFSRNRLCAVAVVMVIASVAHASQADRDHQRQVWDQARMEAERQNRARLEESQRQQAARDQQARDENWRRIQAQYAAEKAAAAASQAWKR